MATSKTLAPTNETISIPALGDAPDASVFSDCIDKEADAINALNSKTEYSGTKNDTYISAIEGRVVKYGKMVSGYFIITANTNFSASDLTLISNLPAPYNGQIQLPCICLSGDDSWKTARVRVTTSGTITTWYGFGFKSGAAYLIPVNYVCS